MPLNYDPSDAAPCWPEGTYDAELAEVTDTTSKTSGAPMQVLTYTVYHDSGKSQQVQDYIVAPATLWKLRQLAVALNKKAEFESGNFQADNQIGAAVKVELIVESQDGYDDRNKIKKVLSAHQTTVEQKRPQPPNGSGIVDRLRDRRAAQPPVTSPIGDEPQFKDDDIPF